MAPFYPEFGGQPISNQVFPQSLDDSLRHTGHMQLLINALDISLYCLEADIAGLGDHLIAHPIHQAAQDLFFPLAEVIGFL